MKRKVKAKDISFQELKEIFDGMYNEKNSGLKLMFDEYCEDKKSDIENSIADDYKFLIKFNPEVTDGQEMFEYWAYEWFKLGWVHHISSSNKSFLV